MESDSALMFCWFVFVLASQCAAMKLAQVLLSSVSEDSYWPPLGPPPAVWLQREGAAASKDAMYPTVKPPQRYGTDWYISSLFSRNGVVRIQ